MTTTRSATSRCASRVAASPFVMLCVLPILIAGCKKRDAAAPVPEVYVQAAHPITVRIGDEISADAILSPLAQAAIAPKVTAPVKKFYVQRGTHVHAGELLATLENNDLAAAAMDNQGSYTAAQATFETATKSTAPEDLTRATLDLAQAKATFELNQSIAKSRANLFKQGAIPGRDLDTANATLVQSRAAYDIASQHLQSLKSVGNKAAIAGAQGNLESAKGKLLGAQAELSYTEIRSPISGVVTDRPLFAGETAPPGTPLITVMDTTTLIAKLHIAQVQAQQLAVGAVATFQVPGIAELVTARVSLISPALDPGSTTVEVWLRVNNTNGELRAGTPVKASIEGRAVANALTIPASAVQTDTDGISKFVMVIAPDSTAHKKTVTIGIKNAQDVQILTGLTSQDMVISTGAYGLDENTRVKIGVEPTSGADQTAAGKDASDK